MEEPRRQGGGEVLSKKIAGSTTYADVDRGTLRFSTRLDDYAEMFGDVAGAFSIPFLDLPPALSCRDADPVSGGFDYSEVFGAVDFGKFATPLEELVAVAPTREDPSSAFGRSKGEAANYRQATGELSSPRHSNGGLMASGDCDPLSSYFNHSGYPATEFDLSHKNTMNRKKEGQMNGTVHTAEDTGNDRAGTGEQQKKIPVSVSSNRSRSSENHSGADNCNSSFSRGSLSSGDASSSRIAYLTVSDISLRTQPLRLPPPSRPPPRLVEKEGCPKARMFSNPKDSLDGASESVSNKALRVHQEVEKGNSHSFLDVEVDVSSSTAAIREAMELAQPKLKGTKELMEKKQYISQTIKEMSRHGSISSKEKLPEKFIDDGQTRQGSESKSSWLSKSADKSEKWKINKEYHELVNTENLEIAEEEISEEVVSLKKAKLATMISEVEQNKSMQDTLSYEIESNWKLKKDIVAPVARALEENANLETHEIHLEEVATQGVVQKLELQYAGEKVHLFSGTEKNVNDNSVLDYVLCNKRGKNKLDSLDACGGENSSHFVEINVEEEIKDEKWKSEAENQVYCRSCIPKVEMEKTTGMREQLSATDLNRNSLLVESGLRATVDQEAYTDEEYLKDQNELVRRDKNEAAPESCNLEKFEGHKMDRRHLWNLGNEDTIEIQVEPYFMDKYMSVNVVPGVSAGPLNDTTDPFNTDLYDHSTTSSDLSMRSMKCHTVISDNIISDIQKSEDREIEEMKKELEEVAEEEQEKQILQEEKENILEDMHSVGLFEERSEIEKQKEEAMLLEEAKEREANLKEEKERARVMEESSERKSKIKDEVRSVVDKIDEDKARLSEQANANQKILQEEILRVEEKEKERKLEEEKERARLVEEQKEREREREKDRMCPKVTTGSSKVEEKASYESSEKPPTENASRDSKLMTECATDERATAEVHECAVERASAADAGEDSERDSTMSRDKFRMEIAEEHLQDGNKDGHDAQFGSAGSSKTCLVNSDSNYQGEGESVLRCKARQERHQRIAQRAAKALAEKNMRDVLAQREQSERERLAEYLDTDLRRWSNGKEGNLRALLSTLQYILGPESGWQPIPLTEVITASGVKKAFRKATLCVHPDKLQQRGANIQQKYISEKVFDLLKEAWNRFNSEER